MKVDVVVVGAGPVGLAAAIEVGRKGLKTVVVDKGALVNSLIGYPTNMEFFSTPDLLEIGGYPLATSRYKPIREETIDYYRRVAEAENIKMLLFEKVLGLEGEAGSFSLDTESRTIQCRYVVVATGFFDQPNLMNVPGEDLPKVSHYYREAFRYTGRDVLIVGAKNSASIAALHCLRRGARVTMVVRGPDIGASVKYWIRPDLMNRIAEGALDVFFNSRVLKIEPDQVTICGEQGEQVLPNDVVLAMTGYHPDYDFLHSLGIAIDGDESETPIYDEATFETSRSGVFIAGTVCGGRHTSRWFIENGRFHAKMIADELEVRNG